MKKLRYKFILITMLSLVAVLILLLGTVGLVNYSNSTKNADELLSVLSINGGSFSSQEVPQQPSGNENDPQGNPTPQEPQFDNKETPYETRYFTVTFKDNDTIVDLSSIASIDEETAIAMADQALEKKSRGYLGVYRYLVTSTDSQTQVLFLDNTRNLESVKNFMVTGAWVSAIGVVMVFILVFFISYKVFAPVQKSYEKQKRFITNSSHELKTPLTIISANNELLEIEYGENESTEAISKQVKRMTTMVKNMTLLSRLDESENLNQVADVNLSSLAEEITGDYQNVFEASGKKFVSEIDPDLHLSGDESLLSQMISLLLDNANKYAISSVFFHLKKNGKFIELTTGNDADIKETDGSVFLERFYRADDSRKKTEGSGIGLSLVQEIVTHHGGTIRISTEKSAYQCTIRLKTL